MYDVIHHMKRTTIFIDEGTEQDLRLLAKRQARPVAALVREALANYVTEHRRGSSELPGFVAADRSGHTDTAERHEEILFEDLEPHSSTTAKGEKPKRRTTRR